MGGVTPLLAPLTRPSLSTFTFTEYREDFLTGALGGATPLMLGARRGDASTGDGEVAVGLLKLFDDSLVCNIGIEGFLGSPPSLLLLGARSVSLDFVELSVGNVREGGLIEVNRGAGFGIH